jgi:tetraacyldisaccharide 4'-kinase
MKRPWLIPLTPLYAAGVALRNWRIENGWEQVRRLRYPVVSIGNLSTGGSGKTPLAIALAKTFTERGLRVDVLSRGYGRRNQRPARVDPDGSAEEFGDEPPLIARETGVPVYVAPQRYEAGLLAEADAASAEQKNRQFNVHLLDDGFQHRQLYREIDILLLDRRDWQDGLLPAGNLREPREAAHRATVIAIPANEPELEAELKAWGWQGPIWRLHRKMETPRVDGSVDAFSGIAHPEQFFTGLEAAGLQLAACTAFPDHHRYTQEDVNRLIASARKSRAVALITTEKDLVRLGTLESIFPAGLPLQIARLRIEIENGDEVIDSLVRRLSEDR